MGAVGREIGSSVLWTLALCIPPLPTSSHSPAFLPVTYLSRAARSHYRGVRKAAGGVASPRARVTDCRSVLAESDWLRWSGSGHRGLEMQGKGRWESSREDDKTWLRDLCDRASYLKGHKVVLLRSCSAAVVTAEVAGPTPGQEEVGLDAGFDGRARGSCCRLQKTAVRISRGRLATCAHSFREGVHPRMDSPLRLRSRCQHRSASPQSHEGLLGNDV